MRPLRLRTPLAHKYIAARAEIELACVSIRAQGQSLNACIADGKVHPVSESDSTIAESLLTDVPERGAQSRCAPLPSQQTCS